MELSSGSWALHDAAGTLTLAMLSGTFAPGTSLFLGDRVIGVVDWEDELSLQPETPPEDAAEDLKDATLEKATESSSFSRSGSNPRTSSPSREPPYNEICFKRHDAPASPTDSSNRTGAHRSGCCVTS